MLWIRSRTPSVHDRTLQTSNGNEKSVNYWAGPDFSTTIPLLCSGTQRGRLVRGWRRAQAVWNCRECSSQTNEILHFGLVQPGQTHPDATTTPFLITMILTTLKCGEIIPAHRCYINATTTEIEGPLLQLSQRIPYTQTEAVKSVLSLGLIRRMILLPILNVPEVRTYNVKVGVKS